MVFGSLMHILSLFLDIIAVLGVTNGDNNLEIIILRQQVRIFKRKVKSAPRISDPVRITLATLTDKFSHSTKDARHPLHQVMLIFKPDTVLRWHPELVRRKWTFRRKGNPGRPKLSSELEALIVRLVKENTRWGYDKIQGELLKLGHHLSARLERGAASWGTTRIRSWLAISSRWRRSRSRPSMCCSS